MAKLVLADMQALATSPDYGGRGFLQPSSAVLGLSAAAFLSDLSLWQGAGYFLTDAEIDDIRAMIAQLENDLIVTGAMYPLDKCKVTRIALQSIPYNTPTVLNWDAEVYDPQDMHDNSTNNHSIYAQRDGLHLIDVHLTWAATPSGARTIHLYKKDLGAGSPYVLAATEFQVVTGSSQLQHSASVQDDALATDQYFVLVIHTVVGGLPIVVNSFSPTFAVARI